MKVCVIGPANTVHTQRWVGALRDRGLKISVLSPSPLPSPLPPTLHGVPIWSFGVGRAGMTRLERLRTLFMGWARVPAMLRLLRPDITHIHSLPTPAAVPFLLRTPRLVVSAWGADVVHDDARKRRLYPLLLAHASAVTATSHDLARVTASYLRRPRPIDEIAFGVDTQLFHPQTRKPNQAFTIGCLKGLVAIAGHDLLLHAFAQLRPAPDGKLPRLRIAGDGPQRQLLLEMITRLGIGDRAELLDALPHAAAPAFLRTLDLYVMPSRSRSESFGVAAAEAQACGIPVVASNIGGVPEVVLDGLTGLLVPPDDVVALRDALQRCLDDRAMLARMSAAASSWVASRYEWRTNVDQMLQVYERVLATA